MAAVIPALMMARRGNAATNASPSPPMIEVGSYQIKLALAPGWRALVQKENGYVLLAYADASDPDLASIGVKIGLFRIVVPTEARQVDRVALAQAYVVQDAAGAQKALFATVTKLVLGNRRGVPLNGGTLLEYIEPIDAMQGRKMSTVFVRACVFFPPSYAKDGVLFLAFGRQESAHLAARADELDIMRQAVAGISTK